MPQERATATRGNIVRTATDLIRRRGYVATRIEDVCEAAGVTKGAFFHHFKTKEDLGEACLHAWEQGAAGMFENAPFLSERDPRKRVLRAMDFFIHVFEGMELRSCLAGTIAQEISETHTQLREGASRCFSVMRERFQALLEDACRGKGRRVDTGSLAEFWMAALQGSLILYKASQDAEVIRKNLRHARKYIESQLPE